jgi:hypothetical protein
MIYDKDECARLKDSVNNALEVLGEEAKMALLFHLKKKLNIKSSLSGDEDIPCPPLADIEAAFRELLGPAAEIIIRRIREAMKGDAAAA